MSHVSKYINGRVIDRHSHEGVIGWRVEIWRRKGTYLRLIGRTRTGDYGDFRFAEDKFPFTPEQFNITLKVFHPKGGKPIAIVEQTLWSWPIENFGVIEVDLSVLKNPVYTKRNKEKLPSSGSEALQDVLVQTYDDKQQNLRVKPQYQKPTARSLKHINKKSSRESNKKTVSKQKAITRPRKINNIPVANKKTNSNVKWINEEKTINKSLVDTKIIGKVETSNSEFERFIVQGKICQDNGSNPLRNIIVTAFDKDLHSEESLGEAKTNEQGKYEIRYSAKQFAADETGSADVFIRIFDIEGTQLDESEVIFDAPVTTTINLLNVQTKKERQSSEYEELVAKLSPVLQKQPLADLKDNDIRFLSAETAVDIRHIESLRQAAQFALETNISDQIFYALDRLNLRSSLEDLLTKPEVLHKSLEQAINKRIIPVIKAGTISKDISHLQKQFGVKV
jgi:hypothetical protein